MKQGVPNVRSRLSSVPWFLPGCARGPQEELGCPGDPFARFQQGAAPDTAVRFRSIARSASTCRKHGTWSVSHRCMVGPTASPTIIGATTVPKKCALFCMRRKTAPPAPPDEQHVASSWTSRLLRIIFQGCSRVGSNLAGRVGSPITRPRPDA